MAPGDYRSAVRSSVARQAASKLGRLRRSGDGRLEPLGHDYDRGHRDYVKELSEGERLWLETKPFAAPPSFELATCLRTFAHIVEELKLGPRAQVLDVGCGPGWMSEYLARCGYWVTGIDISEDMVEIARLRVAQIPDQVGQGIDAHAEFHAMPVREMPWTGRFDAAILYDTMHHFDNMPPVPLTLDGASVLHQMMRVRWAAWRALASTDRAAILEEAAGSLAAMEKQGSGAAGKDRHAAPALYQSELRHHQAADDGLAAEPAAHRTGSAD